MGHKVIFSPSKPLLFADVDDKQEEVTSVILGDFVVITYNANCGGFGLRRRYLKMGTARRCYLTMGMRRVAFQSCLDVAVPMGTRWTACSLSTLAHLGMQSQAPHFRQKLICNLPIQHGLIRQSLTSLTTLDHSRVMCNAHS